MRIPRYRPNELFFKLPKLHQESIISGFPQYYRDNTKSNSKSNDELMNAIENHFLFYDETRLFDKNIQSFVILYSEKVLNEDIISEKYPELFI